MNSISQYEYSSHAEDITDDVQRGMRMPLSHMCAGCGLSATPWQLYTEDMYTGDCSAEEVVTEHGTYPIPLHQKYYD